MRIIFFNNWHYGDLHVSRGFVDAIRNYVKADEFLYAHNNSHVFGGSIIEDKKLLQGLDKWVPFIKKGNDLFINTWYGTSKRKYVYQETLSFSCLYSLFESTCKEALGINLSEIHSDPCKFYPQIDYSLYKIDSINSFMEKHKGVRKVLVCNGNVNSCQAVNFDMWPSIQHVAKKHPRTLWLVTNNNIKTQGNIIYTPDIIQKENGNDLNENSYISTFCDLIVGRFSGPHTYSYTKDNLFNSNKTILSFYNSRNKVIASTDWIGNRFRNKIKYSAKIVDSVYVDTKNVANEISKQIKLRKGK